MDTYLANTANTTALPVPLTPAFQTQIGLAANGHPVPYRFTILEISASFKSSSLVSFDLSQSAGSGASSTLYPVALDPLSPSPAVTAFALHASEPVYTPNTSAFFIATETGFRWQARPGSEIIVLAAAAYNGMGLRASSPGYTGVIANTSMIWQE